MNTLERIDRLFKHHFGTPAKPNYPCNASQNLDRLDDAVGIDTRWLDNHPCRSAPGDGWTCGGDHNYRRYVGARLALHESFAGVSTPHDRRYFHLGREAEKLVA